MEVFQRSDLISLASSKNQNNSSFRYSPHEQVILLLQQSFCPIFFQDLLSIIVEPSLAKNGNHSIAIVIERPNGTVMIIDELHLSLSFVQNYEPSLACFLARRNFLTASIETKLPLCRCFVFVFFFIFWQFFWPWQID